MTENVGELFTTQLQRNKSLTPYEENLFTFWFVAVVYVCIGIVAILGNGLVLYAIYGSRNLSMLHGFDGVIKSLAVADLLVGLIGVPIRVYESYNVGTKVVSNDSYLLDWDHNIILIPNRTFEISSILHVVLLVILRLEAIKHPKKNRMTKHNTILISSIWIISILCSALPICAIIINCKDAIPVIRLVELYCSTVVPVIGIVFTYLQLIWELKKQQKQRNEILTQGIVLKTDDNVKRVRVVVSRIVTVFLICYLPFLAERHYYLIMLSQGSYHGISAMGYFITALTAFLFALNSCANPFIYARSNPTFKSMVKAKVCIWRRQVNRKESSATDDINMDVKRQFDI